MLDLLIAFLLGSISGLFVGAFVMLIIIAVSEVRKEIKHE